MHGTISGPGGEDEKANPNPWSAKKQVQFTSKNEVVICKPGSSLVESSWFRFSEYRAASPTRFCISKPL